VGSVRGGWSLVVWMVFFSCVGLEESIYSFSCI